eukprot:COSAG01_NODE_1328_length_10708_cov_102.064379_11_plen_49_part_00
MDWLFAEALMSEQEREDPQNFPKWIYWYRPKERAGTRARRDDTSVAQC